MPAPMPCAKPPRALRPLRCARHSRPCASPCLVHPSSLCHSTLLVVAYKRASSSPLYPLPSLFSPPSPSLFFSHRSSGRRMSLSLPTLTLPPRHHSPPTVDLLMPYPRHLMFQGILSFPPHFPQSIARCRAAPPRDPPHRPWPTSRRRHGPSPASPTSPTASPCPGAAHARAHFLPAPPHHQRPHTTMSHRHHRRSGRRSRASPVAPRPPVASPPPGIPFHPSPTTAARRRQPHAHAPISSPVLLCEAL